MATYYTELASSPEPDNVKIEDMVSAAQKLSHVLTNAGIRHGFLGGFACRIIGGTRLTADVDCCVEAEWSALREVLKREKGFQLPKSTLVSGVMRIYALIGNEKVQVDVKQAGEGAGPKNLTGKTMEVQGLPTLVFTELIRAKLLAYYKRDGSWDGVDLIFLIQAAGDKVEKNRIPADKVEYFMENFDWSGSNKKYKDVVKKALLT